MLAISNVVESSIPRLADYAFYTHAGPEIGVASTKAFTTQLVALALLAIHLGRAHRRAVARARARAARRAGASCPQKMRDVVEQAARSSRCWPGATASADGFLFLGRGAQYPIALEGALKLKEISYIHAEGYAAGEMKHGPIALIDDKLPVVVLVPRGPAYDKVVSNLAEVRARQGKVLAIATRGDNEIGGHADDVVLVPDTAPELQPILTVRAAPAARLLRRRLQGHRRRPAPQPRQDRHGRVKKKLTHFDAAGAARMVEVGAKPETARQAIASGRIAMQPATAQAVRAGRIGKGDVLGSHGSPASRPRSAPPTGSRCATRYGSPASTSRSRSPATRWRSRRPVHAFDRTRRRDGGPRRGRCRGADGLRHVQGHRSRHGDRGDPPPREARRQIGPLGAVRHAQLRSQSCQEALAGSGPVRRASGHAAGMRRTLLACFLVSVPAAAGPIGAPIVGGTPATAGEFPSVVAVEIGGGLCTGTLITPEWVLTAAHCVLPAEVGASSQAQVTAGLKIHLDTLHAFSGGTTVGASDSFPDPMFNINNLGAHDAGLIKLAAPVTTIKPSPINFDAAAAPIGIAVTMVGFGATGVGGGGQVGIEYVVQQTSVGCSSFAGSDTNLLCFNQVSGKGKCNGDSGGPSFGMIGGQAVEVGITSFGDQTCSQFGADTRVDAEKDFIQLHIPQLYCETDTDCPDMHECFEHKCIVTPFSPTGVGADCMDNAACDSGQCGLVGDSGKCTMSCTIGAADTCPTGLDCIDGGGGAGICWAPDSGGGCCDAGGAGGPTALFGFAFVGLVLRRRKAR